MSTKIFVGNLNFQATEQELQDFLAQYGAVQEVFMPKDRETGKPRGFAFVTFEEDDAAQRALRDLNGKEFAGRPLTVNEARPKEEGAGGGRREGGFGGGRREGGFGGGRREGGFGGGGGRREGGFGGGRREGGFGGGGGGRREGGFGGGRRRDFGDDDYRGR